MPNVTPPETPFTASVPSITAYKVQEKYEAGVRLLQSGHVLAAIQQFHEASFFDAEDALPIVALAECYIFLCDLRSAIRCYRRALWSLHKRKQRPLLNRKNQSVAPIFPTGDIFFSPEQLSSFIAREPNQTAAQSQTLSSPLRPTSLGRPSTAQFLGTPAESSDEALPIVAGSHLASVDVPQWETGDEERTVQPAEGVRRPTRTSIASSTSPQGGEAPLSFDEDNSGRAKFVLPEPTASQETAPPRELTAKEVRARLVGVLDALGLALFQVGSVEQALRCTTEALELLAAADAEKKEKKTAQAGLHGGPAAVRLFTKLSDPYLSEPTVALHRAVFLIALQREEEAEVLLGSHYELFEDCRAQSAPLLIQLYCNRQAFRKARLLLESEEERLQGKATAPEEEGKLVRSENGDSAAVSAAEDETDTDGRPGSASRTQEGRDIEEMMEEDEPVEQPDAPATFPPFPTPLSLTVAKFIFMELYARYRSAALASDDEDSLTRCLDVYPNDVDLLFRRAQLRIAAGELKRSVKDLFRCVQETNGEHKDAIEAMTMVLFTIGSNLDDESDVQNTVSYYSESLKWRPDNLLVLLARGDCYTKMEAFEDALADYQAILNYDPEHAEATQRIAALHDLWGRKFFALDDPAKAEVEFTNAIKTDSKNPEFYYHRALCRLKLNQGQYALRDVLSCKELNPSAPHLREFIARYVEPMQLTDATDEECGKTTPNRATAADSNRRTPNLKMNVAARWYGSRTPLSLPIEGLRGRGKAASRKKRHENSADYATLLPSRSSASVPLPRISSRAVAPRDAAAEGWVQGRHTTLHRRQGETISQSK